MVSENNDSGVKKYFIRFYSEGYIQKNDYLLGTHQNKATRIHSRVYSRKDKNKNVLRQNTSCVLKRKKRKNWPDKDGDIQNKMFSLSYYNFLKLFL